jgi:hypothetical protein
LILKFDVAGFEDLLIRQVFFGKLIQIGKVSTIDTAVKVV